MEIAAMCLLVGLSWPLSAIAIATDAPTSSPTPSPTIAVATLASFSRNDTFEIIGPHIVVNGRPTVFTGVNTMHIYGGNSDNYPQLGISMVREFVGAVAHVPMYGNSASVIDGEYLHPLGKVLDNNEENGLVTILDLHRWNKSDTTEFWAKTPSQTPWYDAFLARVTTDFAELLSRRPNVFLSIWNEPFHWDNADGHMDADSDLWFDEMNALVTTIRNANITNVLVVPVGRMGQAEEILLVNFNAQRLLALHSNLLFDVHAYTRWLKPSGFTPSPEAEIRARLSALYEADIAVVIGEIGPSIAGSLRDPQPFLTVARELGTSVLAWQWCGDDGNALMSASSDCTTHNTAVENLNWASTFFTFTALQSFTTHRHNQLAQRQRKVFLHYLPWYSDVGAGGVRNGWCAAGDVTCALNSNNQQYVGPGPMIGEYDQYDDQIIEYHLLLAFVANVDGLIVNINPTSSSQLAILVGVVEKVVELQHQFSWFDLKLILSYDDPNAVDVSTIAQQLETLRDSFYHNNSVSSAFFTDDFSKRFPLMSWSDQAADLYDVAACSVFETSPNILTINRNARNFDDSHGNMAWIGTMSTSQTTNTNWGEDYLVDFEWRMQNQFQLSDMTGVGRQFAARFEVGCVWPGFDDSKVPVSWNGGNARYIADTVADGSTLELCFDFAINRTTPDNNLNTVPVDMPWLQVATFNDWPEGTAVEPTANISDPYRRLRQVQHHSTGFTLNTPRHNDSEAEAALTFPMAVLHLRQSPSAFVSTMAIANAINTLAGGHATEALAMLALQPAGHLAFPETIRASTAQTKLELLRSETYTDGLVVLEDAVDAGYSAGVAAVMTKQCYSASKIEAIVSYEAQNITSNEYQGKLSLLATMTSTLDTSTGVTGFDAKFTRTIHAAIDHTYLGLENATGATLSDGHTGRQDEGRMKYVLMQGQTIEAEIFSAEIGWRSVEDYQKGTTLGVGVGCFRIGVQLAPNYNNAISIPLNYLRVLIDNDADNVYDHIETLLGSSPDAVDTDNDGVNDSDDPKPTDSDTRVVLPLPLSCTDASMTRMQAGNGGVVLFVRNGQSGTCVISFSHENIGWNAKHAEAYAVDLHHDHPIRVDFNPNDTLVLNVRAHEDHYFQLVDGDFPPIVDTDVAQVIFEANTTATMSLLSLAYDFEDNADDLIWSVESHHNSSELRIVIDVVNNTLTFVEELPECRTHIVKLRVTDSASNHADMEFALYILQPGEDAVPLLNAGFENIGANRYSLEGWKGYTWGGTYDAAVSASNMSASHGLSMAIEGLSKGRYGIYQTISMSKGTYRLTFMLAHREVVAGDYGNVIDILFISHPQAGVDELLIQPVDVVGDSDWRTITFEFAIDYPQPRTTKFYLRFFGTGYVFFDDVIMTKLLCHQPLASNVLTVSSVQSALVFVFPFKPDVDGVLCGYCEEGDNREMCVRCVEANYTFVASTNVSKPFSIASFDVNTDTPFQVGGWAYDTTTFASRSVLIPDTYISAYDNTGLISDWSKWDMLKVDVYNGNANAEQFYVEIRDSQSNGYWSRVNWYTAVSPGYSTITVPLQMFVGEKTVTVERRRLDLTSITRLVFASTLCHCNLIIDNVRLEAEPVYNNLFSKLLRFDFGLESSPVEIGFAPVTPGDWYRARLGYGIDTDSTIGRTEDRRHPTDLLRDWISFNSGGLNIDLLNGDYVVALVMEDPGYWEYFPSFSQRKVKAEGITVLDESMNYSQFLSKYFNHQDTEDLPGDDIFSKYIRNRYTPLIFETSVADSQLNVHFETANTYACTVSTIIIFPKEEEQLGMGFLDELWDRMKLHFDAEYASAEYPATSGASIDENKPFALFSRSPEHEVRGFDKPTLTDVNLWEKGWEINSIALGETTSISFALHPPTSRVITSLAFTDDVGAKNITIFSVRHKIKRLSESVYTATPLLMDPLVLPFSLKRGATRQFLLQFHFETSGCIKGSVVVNFEDGANMSIPIAVMVSQFSLEQVPRDIQIGYLGTSPIVTGTTFTEFDAVEQAGFEAAALTLKNLGMTGISGGLGGPNVKGYDNVGDIDVDFTATDTTMTVLDQHWNKDVPVNSYFGLTLRGVSTSSSTWNPASSADVFGVDYDDVIADVLEAVATHAKANDWRVLYHNLGDEPSDETTLRVLQVAQTFKQSSPSTLTSVFTSIESNTSVKLSFADNVDLIILNHHSEEAIRALKRRNGNVSFMVYNQASRYRSGAYLYRLSTLGGLGHYQFALSSPGADPYYALDAREDDLCLLFLRSDGSMTKTLEIEVARAAVIDLRYVLTLNKLVVGGLLNGYDAVAFAAAQVYLTTLTDRMAVGTQAPQMSHAQLDEMCANISDLVMAVKFGDKNVSTTCDVGVVGAHYTEPSSQTQVCGDGDAGELVLVFRQTASPSFHTTSNWSSYNDNNITSDLYSALHKLEDFRLANNSFIFKLTWSFQTTATTTTNTTTNTTTTLEAQAGVGPGDEVGTDGPSLLWTQSSNPHTSDVNVIDAYALIRDTTNTNTTRGSVFGGLAASSSAFAHLDGNPNQPWWYYAIGVSHTYANGIPAFGRAPASVVELYACSML